MFRSSHFYPWLVRMTVKCSFQYLNCLIDQLNILVDRWWVGHLQLFYKNHEEAGCQLHLGRVGGYPHIQLLVGRCLDIVGRSRLFQHEVSWTVLGYC